MQIPFELVIVFMAVAVSKKDDLNGLNMAMDMGKHEYCVKLVVACEKLRDKIEKYPDSDIYETDQDSLDDALTKYKLMDCVPKGLSQSGLREFYHLVADWENDVEKLFLHQNLFGVVKENDGGRKISVNFGLNHGWCPLYDDIEGTTLPENTTSGEESPEESSTLNSDLVTKKTNNYQKILNGSTMDLCNVSSTVDLWVHNEINGTLNMSNLTDRFVEFEKLLNKYSKHSCCPYESIRDRMEMINDGIDILEDLQDLKPSEKKDNTDIESDYRNLNRRLEHLRIGHANYSTGKCCPAFLDHLKSYQNQFESNLTDISPQKSNINLKDLLKKATALEDACSQQQSQLKKSFPNLNNNNMNNKNNNTTTDNICCVEETKKINLIENSLKDLQFNKFQQDFPEKINSLRANLAKTSTTLSDTENLLDLEGKQIEKLKTECGKISQIKGRTSLIKSLSSNVSKPDKLNDMEFIRTVDLSKLKTLSKPINNMAKMDFNALFQSKSEKCKQNIETLTNTFREVSLRNNKSHDFHERYQPAAKEILLTHRKRIEDLNESVKAIEASSKESPTQDINKLEKDLMNLTEVAIPKLALDIIKSKKGKAGKSRENKKHLALFNEEIKRKKAQILERLDKLYNNKPTDDSEKMRQLEELISQLSDRHASLAKRIADRHEFLKTSANELNQRIVKALSDANSCRSACKFDDLPTVDALAKRVKALEAKLKIYLKKKPNN